MNLVIRADASIGIGTGHVMRCLALAQAWQERVGPVSLVGSIDSRELRRRLRREELALHPASGPVGSAEDASQTTAVARRAGSEWVVVDGYRFAASYRAALRRAGFRLLVVDDLGDLGPYDAELVLNQNANADPRLYPDLPPSTRLLAGTRYALLRREFLSADRPSRTVATRARRLLILMGGADSGNATLRVMEALSLLRDDGLACEAVLGAANPHRDALLAGSASLGLRVEVVQDPPDLPERMARADLAISAGGSTLWELCHFGLPTIAVSLADNQRAAVAHLDRAGALIDATAAWAGSTAELSRSMADLVADGALRAVLSRTARALVDGRGAARVVDALLEPGEGADDRPA